MSDRIYKFGRFMTGGGVPSAFTYDGVQHGFAVRGWRGFGNQYNTSSNYGDAWLALDNNPGSAFYLSERAWLNYAWELRFNDALPMMSVQYAYSTSFHVRPPIVYLQYYDGANWITLTSVTASWSHSGLFVPAQWPLMIKGIRLYMDTRYYVWNSFGDFQVSDIIINFLMKDESVNTSGLMLEEPVNSNILGPQCCSGTFLQAGTHGTKTPADFNALQLQELSGGIKLPPANQNALALQEFVDAQRSVHDRNGNLPEVLLPGNFSSLDHDGFFQNDAEPGTRTADHKGFLIDPMLCGMRQSNRAGSLLDDSVIPEHILRNQGYAFIL
jgi:hypothetical protein